MMVALAVLFILIFLWASRPTRILRTASASLIWWDKSWSWSLSSHICVLEMLHKVSTTILPLPHVSHPFKQSSPGTSRPAHVDSNLTREKKSDYRSFQISLILALPDKLWFNLCHKEDCSKALKSLFQCSSVLKTLTHAGSHRFLPDNVYLNFHFLKVSTCILIESAFIF